ncbi:AMP-binding protein [Antrihabitans cavernicola]|uniref:AMP-binding protein n=1 Tax=Antrihabitans cavernicola TaxID=2495913 RepID=A0A5A7SJC6_9NOCA|nr:AMP-binding protein [Spelaeibacter cavernicola]KAA0024857.1 AMP-binding protein [Spelaeibacter cavernicola]
MASDRTAFGDDAIRNGFDALCGWLPNPHTEEGIKLADEDDSWEYRSYASLATDVRRVAGILRAHGVQPGSGVCLILPTDYVCIASMYAAWLCGATLTLIAPPGFGDGDEYASRVRSIIDQTDARIVATSPGLAAMVRGAMTEAGLDAAPLILDAATVGAAEPIESAVPTELPECALLQFTSGSLGSPRGVRISWQNLQANIDYIISAVDYRDGEATASWLPLYHDMGLIGGFLATIAMQGSLYLLRPDQFIRDPLRWLRAMEHAQHTVTPSFGLGYSAHRLRPEDVAGLDLSGWRSIVTGAEPVDVTHLQKFAELLDGSGFSTDTYRPAYGLAESTLMVCMARPYRQPLMAVQVDSASLQFGKPVTIHAETEYTGRELTGIGWVIGVGESTPESSVRIADDNGVDLPDGTLGEIVVSGPSVASGYHGVEPADRAASATTRFTDHELYSGDAGFIHCGQLFVFGRMGSSLKVRGKSVFMEDVETRVAFEAGLSKGKVAAVAMQEADAQGIALFVEGEPGEWITEARRVLRAELGPAHNVRIVTGNRGLIRRTSSGKPRRRHMWELLKTGRLADDVVVHDALTPIGGAAPEHQPLLSDDAIARLLTRALESVDVAPDATILLEGSIAEGFGNEASDIDFFVLAPGDAQTPAMPTVLFIDGRRVEVRTRSHAQLRKHFQYAQSNVAGKPAALLDLDQDVLNRCQRSLRAKVVRPGEDSGEFDDLMAVLPYADFSALMQTWWTARAQQSLRHAVALNALGAVPDALGWARDGLQQAVKGWAAGKGETYLETKWLGPQLDRIGKDELIDRYYALDSALADETNVLDAAIELAIAFGVESVANDANLVRFARAPGVTTWPIGSRLHVMRGDSDIFVLSDAAAVAWRSVVFGRSVAEILDRSSLDIAPDIAEFVRLGFVGLRWERREPIRPALAMCKPAKPYTCPPSGPAVLLGLAGAARVDGKATTLSPLPARRFTECASELIWSNVVLENAREDLVGAIKHGQGRVADVAAQRLITASVRVLVSTLGCSPLPEDVAAVATLRRLIPDHAENRDALLDQLRAAQRVRFFDDPERSHEGLAVLDGFVDAIRDMAGADFPASFNSREQWRNTLAISYDWLRLAGYLDTSLPIDEAQDLLASGGVQPHLSDEASRKDASS